MSGHYVPYGIQSFFVKGAASRIEDLLLLVSLPADSDDHYTENKYNTFSPVPDTVAGPDGILAFAHGEGPWSQ